MVLYGASKKRQSFCVKVWDMSLNVELTLASMNFRQKSGKEYPMR